MKTTVRLSSLRKPSRLFLSKRQRQIIGWVIFTIGLLFGFGLTILTVLTNLEGAAFWGDTRYSMAYDRNQPVQAELTGIHCPILLAPGEEGTVTATFRNLHPQEATILVTAFVSERDNQNFRVVTRSLPIGPGENQQFQWQITGQDIIEQNYILTRVYLMNQEFSNPYPSRTDACGSFVWSLFGLKGGWEVALMVGISLAGLGLGRVLIPRRYVPAQSASASIDNGLYGLAGIIVISMAASLIGWWVIAGLFLLLAVLLTSILIPSMVF